MKINSKTFAHHGQKRLTFLRDPEEGGGGGEGGENGKPPADEDKGKPSQFKAPQSQEEFDRIIQDRVRRVESKYADYDSLKAKATQYDALEQASLSDVERDIREAREEAYHEAMSQAVPKAVRQAFRAEAKGVLTKEQIDGLLEDIDLVKYATDDGDPDEEKIAKKVALLAPKKGGGGGPGFGQGSGHDQSSARPGEGGALEAARRFGQTQNAAAKS